MLRALFLASLVLVSAGAAYAQPLSVLRIKVVVIDSERTATPVARHVLLVSDNPPSAPPRAIVTAADGTATVRLRPGNYTVESERPVAFQGRAYQWTQRVDIAAGLDAMLELTADNAAVEPLASATTASASPLETDPSFLMPQWQGSVVALWTPTTHASGFIVDAKGLIATNQRVVGTATTVEVQLTPEVKVTARVLAADSMRDVAVLWIDPAVAASVRPVPLGCSSAARPPVVAKQELFTIGTPLRGPEGHAPPERSVASSHIPSWPTSGSHPAAREARSSMPPARWLGSPRSRPTTMRAGVGRPASSASRMRATSWHPRRRRCRMCRPPVRRSCPWIQCGRFPGTHSRRRRNAARAA